MRLHANGAIIPDVLLNAVMRAELFSPPTLVFNCDFSTSASGWLQEHGCTCSELPLSAQSDPSTRCR